MQRSASSTHLVPGTKYFGPGASKAGAETLGASWHFVSEPAPLREPNVEGPCKSGRLTATGAAATVAGVVFDRTAFSAARHRPRRGTIGMRVCWARIGR